MDLVSPPSGMERITAGRYQLFLQRLRGPSGLGRVRGAMDQDGRHASAQRGGGGASKVKGRSFYRL
eukprot:5599543-Prorocentrum_lima.AAC.1